ncbi:MAG: CrcB family protein [Opitutaceae bacterium]
MNVTSLAWVAVGGALGSVARAALAWMIPAGRLPWATIIVNLAGSLLIGWLVARLSPLTEENLGGYSFWVMGICGGFTTFSSFSWQSLALMQKGEWGMAAANILLSVTLCLLATWCGWRLAR